MIGIFIDCKCMINTELQYNKKPSPRPLGSGTPKTLSYRPRHISFYPIAHLPHLSEYDIGLFLGFVVAFFSLVGVPGLGQRSRLWSVRFLPLETFFSNVSELLTVITLDSLLIFLLPSFFQEAGPWGKGWRSSSRYLDRKSVV